MAPDLIPRNSHTLRRSWIPVIVLALCLPSACNTTPESRIDHPGVNAQDLLIVDCLLPPQVRQLGTHLTYLGQRRAIRTSGADCALRGGEYVAYNRADFKSALAVWLPLAEQGDPEAQTYVGEIHEKGRGTRQSYELAAGWYQRAADQNYSRAKINLGYLYESGLGVERNLTRALNLYREASGFTAAQLEFVSDSQLAKRQATENQNQHLQTEVQRLQSDILAGHKQLRTQENQLLQGQNDLRKLQKALSARNSTEDAGNKSSHSEQPGEHHRQLEKLQARLIRTFNQKQLLEDQLTRQNTNTAALQQQLSETQASVKQLKHELETNKQKIDRLEQQNALGGDSAKASAEALLKAKNDAKTLALEMTTLENRNQQQLAWYNARVAEVQQSKSALHRQIEQHESTIADIDQQRKDAVANYQRQLIDQDAQIKLARQKNQHLEKRSTAQRISDEQKLQKLQQVIEQRETDLERQAKTINDLQSSLISQASSYSAMRSTEAPEPPQGVRKRIPIDNLALGNYHALVIGNDTYRSLQNLRTAGNDAIAVEQLLREKYGFKTVLLLDANQKTILSALERMRATLGQQDNLLIYYAGHGELDRQSGRGYWLPVDSDINDKKQWIANNAITAMIDAMNAKHVLVIADSCYSGYLTRTSIARPLSAVSAELRLKWLRAVSQSRVRTVLSSGGTQPVLDGSEHSNHSIFARYFLETLERNTEILETYELFFELQQKVSGAAARLNVEQIPQYAPIRHAGHQAGEFIFAPIAQSTVGGTADFEPTNNQ